MPWSTQFDQPVPVPGGKLKNLQDAADYVQRLPAKKQRDWSSAVEVLIHAAETGGPWVQLARMAVHKALR